MAKGKMDYENRQLRMKINVFELKQNEILNELHEVRRINRHLHKQVNKLTFANRTSSPEVQSYSSDNNDKINFQPTQEEEKRIDAYPTDQHQKSIPLIFAQENYTGKKGIRQTGGMNIADNESKRLLLNSEYLKYKLNIISI